MPTTGYESHVLIGIIFGFAQIKTTPLNYRGTSSIRNTPLNYRGTSSIRNSAPLGPYSRTMPRALWKP